MSLGELHANEPPQPCVARDIKAAVTLIPRWDESRTETLGLGSCNLCKFICHRSAITYQYDPRAVDDILHENEREYRC